ncbi:MAG: cytochrome c peroxidase, partial [Campylobacterota bacterium]|nr:cytochrome c peroxidase [Campylobacterota bacterium]
SCHDIFKAGGADKRMVSLGIEDKKGNIQSPTVLNSRYNFKQFWNGRADTLLEQANGPIHNPVEMALDAPTVEKRLNSSQHYQRVFSELTHQKVITFEMVLDAIVEFEKALVTPNSRFDQFLRGEITLNKLEKRGYQTFKELGCITCHNGINVGGNSFQKMGLITPYKYNKCYPDRYAITKKEQHKNVFKVPTLRNIALTAPYFHDGSAATLKEAIKIMSDHNLGYLHSDEEIKAIVAFLNSLTGDMPTIMKE